MKGIAVTAAAGLLIASLVCPATTRAQPPEPDKKNKLTLSEVEAQVEALQTALAAVVPDDFAVVSASGALNRGSASAVSVSNPLTGEYEVTFNKNITACAYNATIGDIGTYPPNPGEIAVSNISGVEDTVRVDTWDSAGTVADSPFHLSLSCP